MKEAGRLYIMQLTEVIWISNTWLIKANIDYEDLNGETPFILRSEAEVNCAFLIEKMRRLISMIIKAIVFHITAQNCTDWVLKS
ncbi:hypothetical protein CS542_09965 [Pedobacter sp. IW39]|nr:hypothetical protein CS542_09965 [Pedobacter sp. IW39]